MYGRPINFTLKGEEKFKSCCGGCSTVLVAISLIFITLNSYMKGIIVKYDWSIAYIE